MARRSGFLRCARACRTKNCAASRLRRSIACARCQSIHQDRCAALRALRTGCIASAAALSRVIAIPICATRFMASANATARAYCCSPPRNTAEAEVEVVAVVAVTPAAVVAVEPRVAAALAAGPAVEREAVTAAAPERAGA